MLDLRVFVLCKFHGRYQIPSLLRCGRLSINHSAHSVDTPSIYGFIAANVHCRQELNCRNLPVPLIVGKKEMQMSIWTIIFVVLLIAWISGFTVFHVSGGLIHLLLIFAVISLVLHFVMGRRAV